jgi:hypothetical protein
MIAIHFHGSIGQITVQQCIADNAKGLSSEFFLFNPTEQF